MAIAYNLKGLAVGVIDQYLVAAKACVDTRLPDGGILGYPAALLLLCVTDAMGHSLTAKGGDTRLEVLTLSPFNLTLSSKQLKNLKVWYRNSLVHNGLIAPGAYLTTDAQGEPFDFDVSGALTLVRVPVLYETVRAAWEQHKTAFRPSTPDLLGLPKQQPGVVSTFTPAASGVVFAAFGQTRERL